MLDSRYWMLDNHLGLCYTDQGLTKVVIQKETCYKGRVISEISTAIFYKLISRINNKFPPE